LSTPPVCVCMVCTRCKQRVCSSYWATLQYYSLCTLLVPSTRRSTLGDRSFSVAAARAWNALPQHVRNVPSLLVFRRELKNVLFRIFLFGIWTRVAPRRSILDGDAHWCRLLNMTEPSMWCGGNEVFLSIYIDHLFYIITCCFGVANSTLQGAD